LGEGGIQLGGVWGSGGEGVLAPPWGGVGPLALLENRLVETQELCYDRSIKKLPPAQKRREATTKQRGRGRGVLGGKRPGRAAANG
jgi:hypothetical protein